MNEHTTSRTGTIVLFTITGILSCVCVILVAWRLLSRQISSVEPTQNLASDQAMLATENPLLTATLAPTQGPLYLPLISSFPTLTPTPVPDVIILAPTINFLEGPGNHYPVVGQVSQDVPLY